jgi:hypothetical protein
MPDPVSSSVVVCETILTEGSGLLSAIRIMNTLTLPAGANFARFFVLTQVHAQPGDFQPHVLRVRMVFPQGDGCVEVASASEYRFFYGHKVGPGPGGLNLTTEFNIDLRMLGQLGTYYLQAFLDGQYLNQCPLTLKR